MGDKSSIQKAAEVIFEAAELSMDRVIELEAEHGRCFNYRRFHKTDIWIFEDKYEYRVERD